MASIDPNEYQKRLDKLTSMLGDMVRHADTQAQSRCPYKNRHGECTAQFGCRNQRKSQKKEDALLCVGDDKLDYRSAWESEQRPLNAPSTEGIAHVLCGDQSHPSTKHHTLFDAADALSVAVPTSCHRSGSCHECIVEIKRGMDALNGRTDEEAFLRDEYRLACQAAIVDPDIDIEFAPLNRAPRILTLTTDAPRHIRPLVVRDGDQVYYDGELLDTYRGRLLGIAIDLGTTTVAMELVDLESGQSIEVASFENPQRFGGSDVMYRISYDREHPRELRQAILRSINRQIAQWSAVHNVHRHCIYEIVVAGNSTMREILFRYDVQSIGQKPYKSQVELEYRAGKRLHTALTEKTRRLGLRAHPKARVYGLPLIASHVGADVAADLCATGLDAQADGALLIDVGTNTEVVAIHNGRMVAASSPAGPAFEGGTVTYGMPGYEGAIERLQWNGTGWDYQTIGDGAALGICGSGLIDLLAELRRHDLMSPKGVFSGRKKQLIIDDDSGITFSRLDASNLAQAKAANYCGQYIVLRALGLSPNRVNKLYLAGGFAHYVDAQAAIDIGFLAPVPVERIEKVGNASLQGARDVLLSTDKRLQLEGLVGQIEHIELETTSDFFELFVDGCQFKPMPSNLS